MAMSTLWKLRVTGVAFLIGAAVVAVVFRSLTKDINADDTVASAFDDARDEDENLRFESLEIKGVEPDGSVPPDGRVRVWFRDPAREVVKATQKMPGAPKRGGDTCQGYEVRASYGGRRGRTRRDDSDWTHDSNCGPTTTRALKCTVAQIWQRAIAKGAPNPAIAEVSAVVQPDGSIHWRLEIDERKYEFDDDCNAAL